MRYEYLYDHEMFDISANGQYCGVLVPTHVMKKFMKISAKWSAEIRQLFNEHKDELLVSDWTGVFPADENGKIVGSETVTYSCPEDFNELQGRIALFVPKPPEHKDVYICKRETAKQIAQEIWDEKQQEMVQAERTDEDDGKQKPLPVQETGPQGNESHDWRNHNP